MPKLRQYTNARVAKSLGSADDYSGWGINKCAPQIGDTGFLIDILTASDGATNYVVESSQPDGMTIRLADFTSEELESLE